MRDEKYAGAAAIEEVDEIGPQPRKPGEKDGYIFWIVDQPFAANPAS